jgi:hypothetical protein
MTVFTDVRNPVALQDGRINCEILHVDYGWIPFTAAPDDDVQYGRDLHEALQAGEHGTVAAYVPPDAAVVLAAERAGMVPFYTAFRLAMKQTPATGFAHLLDRVTQAVAAARVADPFSDIVIWSDSVTQIVRTHPDMTAFAALFDLTPEALDDLCRLAMQIEAGV